METLHNFFISGRPGMKGCRNTTLQVVLCQPASFPKPRRSFGQNDYCETIPFGITYRSASRADSCAAACDSISAVICSRFRIFCFADSVMRVSI